MTIRSNMPSLIVLLLVVTACDQSAGPYMMENKENYSLCPLVNDARTKLYASLVKFAAEHHAEFSDRGAQAQAELSNLKSGKSALASTGGDLVVLTVDRPGEFRVSLSNLGLKEKFALSIRYWHRSKENSDIAALLNEVARFWSVQEVAGGITNEPPCPPIS